MTRLCVPIFVHSIESAKRDIALALEAGADTIELRMDHLPDAAVANELATFCRPNAWTIVTCRSPLEGGLTTVDEATRLACLAGATDATFVDVEWESFAQPDVAAHFAERAVITSAHDFKTRPAKLYSMLAEMDASSAKVIKIVWQARSVRDNLELFELLNTRQRSTIALCMGEAGIASRILAKKFDAFLTFASLDVGAESAPGQLSIQAMKELYRWDAISASTKVFGVIASPVAHSLSPAIHNAALTATNFDGVYLPLLVEAGYESFKAFIESAIAFAPLDLTGLSITIPHKENALRYLKSKGAEIEPLAEKVGAINTIVIRRSSRDSAPQLFGANTDVPAILDSITHALRIDRSELAGKRVAVIGAGGTGRAAVAAMASCGATVVVYNRTFERAVALADELKDLPGKVVAARLEKLCDSCCEIYINTTSVGMHPHVGDSAWGKTLPTMSSGSLVFDAVYNPAETTFLKEAHAAGARTVNGLEMFVRQASRQFELFTDLPAPIDTMRSVINRQLKK